MRFRLLTLSLSVLVAAPNLFAQPSVPTLQQPIPAQVLSTTGTSIMIDLRKHFGVPGVIGTKFAIFDTVVGRFSVELRDDAAPRHVENFLTYVEAGDYARTAIHHVAKASPVSYIVGGTYKENFSIWVLPHNLPVPAEYRLDNARGTLAAAKTQQLTNGGDGPLPPVGEATNEWFLNVTDNTRQLSPSNGFGYTVFGRVLGTGMSVIDAIATLPTVNLNWLTDPNGLFGSVPVRNGFTWPSNQGLSERYTVVVNSILPATLFPTGAGLSVNDLLVQNSAPAVVQINLAGSALTLKPLAVGTASVTVRMTDINGNTAEDTFSVAVKADAPVFSSQPESKTVAAGGTAVFNASVTNARAYRWERNGVEVPGATSSILVVNHAALSTAGNYVAVITTDLDVTMRSGAATLTVLDLPPVDVGRLANLSVMTSAGVGTKVLTIGASVGGGDPNGALPLVIRAVGPTLSQPPFNIPGALADPVLTLYAAGSTTPIDANDNWGGTAALAAAFRSTGAFELPSASLDSAIARTTPGFAAGGYTIEVAGKGEVNGGVLADIYDAAGSARTPATPRLVNISARVPVDPGHALVLGFMIIGRSGGTVLVRGVGPSLAQFGLAAVMANPRLQLFNHSTGEETASNDDWGGGVEISNVAASVGAFPLPSGSSHDAVLLVTLAPGPYSVRLTGVGGAGGTVLVELYEIQ